MYRSLPGELSKGTFQSAPGRPQAAPLRHATAWKYALETQSQSSCLDKIPTCSFPKCNLSYFTFWGMSQINTQWKSKYWWTFGCFLPSCKQDLVIDFINLMLTSLENLNISVKTDIPRGITLSWGYTLWDGVWGHVTTLMREHFLEIAGDEVLARSNCLSGITGLPSRPSFISNYADMY